MYQAEKTCGNVMETTGGEPGCSMAHPASEVEHPCSGRVGVCLDKKGLPRSSGVCSSFPLRQCPPRQPATNPYGQKTVLSQSCFFESLGVCKSLNS